MTTKNYVRNYVIRYEDWDSYNAHSKEEAIDIFKKEHPTSEIIEIEG